MPDLVHHTELLFNSFSSLIGRELLVLGGSREERARCLFDAPFVVVSHGLENDPILNYGNKKALCLWEMTWEEFVQTPSRKTAEPVHQHERTRLLDRTSSGIFLTRADAIMVRLQPSIPGTIYLR